MCLLGVDPRANCWPCLGQVLLQSGNSCLLTLESPGECIYLQYFQVVFFPQLFIFLCFLLFLYVSFSELLSRYQLCGKYFPLSSLNHFSGAVYTFHKVGIQRFYSFKCEFEWWRGKDHMLCLTEVCDGFAFCSDIIWNIRLVFKAKFNYFLSICVWSCLMSILWYV